MALLPESASPPNGVVDFSKTKSVLPPEDDLEDGEIFDDEDDEPQEFPPQQTLIQQQGPAATAVGSTTAKSSSTGSRGRSSSPQSSCGGGYGGSSNSNNQIANNNNLNENSGGFSRSSDSRRGASPLGDRGGKGRNRTRRKRPREEERGFQRKKRRVEENDSKALREKNAVEEEEELFDEPPQNQNQTNDWDDRPPRSDEEDDEMDFDERQRGATGASGDRRRAGPASRNLSSTGNSGQNRTRRSRQRNQNNKKAQRNGRELKSVCKYFLNGHCQRGADCPFSHSTNPLRKFEVCKFYQNDCCAKKDSCVYMHSDYPCRFHHLGLKCYAGKRCKFSHSKVTPYTKQMLIKQNQSEADKHFLQTLPTTSPRRGDSRSPTPEFEFNSGGNSGRRHQSSHHSNDFQMDGNEDVGDEYDQNDDYQEDFDHHSNEHQQGRNQMQHQQDFRDDDQQQQQPVHHHHHHHHENSMRGGDRDRGSDRGNDRGDRGYRGERDGTRNVGRGGRGARRQNQRNRRRSPDRMGPRHFSQHESKSHQDFNNYDDSGNEEGNTPMPSPTGDNLGERDLDEEEGELGFEQPAEIHRRTEEHPKFTEEHPPVDPPPTDVQVDRPEAMNVDAPPEQLSQPLEMKQEQSDEQDIPPNLPKKQRELYLRIQQQQQQRDTHNIKQGDEDDEKEMEYKEDDWYSSDDETNSRPLDVILNKIKPKTMKTEVQKEDVTPSLLDFDVSAVSKLLSSVRETIEQKKQSAAEQTVEPQKPEENRKARDPRMRARTPPPVSRPETITSAPRFPSLLTAARPTPHVLGKQGDVDLRVSRPPADVDLRQLPFKPAPVHQAANEIDASINANPSITYCPRTFTPPPKPDYSHVPIKNPNDPRLKKYIVAGALPSQPLPSVAPIPSLPPFMMGSGAPPVGPQPSTPMVMMNPPQPQPQRQLPQPTAPLSLQPAMRDPRQRALANDPRRKPLLPTPPGPPNLSAMGPNMMPPMGMSVVGMPMNMPPMQQQMVMGPQGQMYGQGHNPVQGGHDSDLRRPPGGPFPLVGDVDLRFQQGGPPHFPFK